MIYHNFSYSILKMFNFFLKQFVRVKRENISRHIFVAKKTHILPLKSIAITSEHHTQRVL